LLGDALGWAPAVVFGASGLAIVPLAMWLGRATEELALRTGSALGALLNATFGNAIEIIIALIAVHAGLIDVVKGSLAGSVISNLLVLLVATVAIAVMSEILVNSVNGGTQELGWSQLFIGVIFIPIIGNAAEQMTAVIVAAKGKMNLSIGIALGSSQQVALLVAPLIVFASIPLGHPMDLLFRPIELLALVVAVAIAGLITQDGESNWFEGAQLLIAYRIIAAALFLYR
jgi:Ca2+/H+ antiporter